MIIVSGDQEKTGDTGKNAGKIKRVNIKNKQWCQLMHGFNAGVCAVLWFQRLKTLCVSSWF